MSLSLGALFKAAKRELLYRAPAGLNLNPHDPKGLDANDGLSKDKTRAQPGYSWEKFFPVGVFIDYNSKPDNHSVSIRWPDFLKGLGS